MSQYSGFLRVGTSAADLGTALRINLIAEAATLLAKAASQVRSGDLRSNDATCDGR